MRIFGREPLGYLGKGLASFERREPRQDQCVLERSLGGILHPGPDKCQEEFLRFGNSAPGALYSGPYSATAIVSTVSVRSADPAVPSLVKNCTLTLCLPGASPVFIHVNERAFDPPFVLVESRPRTAFGLIFADEPSTWISTTNTAALSFEVKAFTCVSRCITSVHFACTRANRML